MKISIIYFSKTGKTREMAEVIKKSIQKDYDATVMLFSVEETLSGKDFINDSDAVIFGTPTYYANTCYQIKKWIDESRDYKLAGKIGAVFATADYPQGGADVAIMTIVGHLMVKGMLVYSGGSAYGQPFIHLGAVALKENFQESKEMFKVFGNRIAQQTKKVFYT